jgi:protease IV
VIQGQVENTYRDFIARVAQARKMSPAAVDRIAQGRVWDGGAARQIGLVDQYGGLEDALQWAAAKAGVAKSGWHPVYLGAETTTYDTLLRRWLVDGEEARARGPRRDVMGLLAAQQQVLGARLQRDLGRLLGAGGLQAYCLECPAAEGAGPGANANPLGGWLGALAALFARLG